MKFFKTLFAETKSLWFQKYATQDFWKLYSIRPRYSSFKHFHECSASNEIRPKYAHCSASDEIHSTYAQHILDDDFEMGCDSPYNGYLLAEHARKLVYSLAVHTQKSVWHTLSQHVHFYSFYSFCTIIFPSHPFLCPLSLPLSNVLCHLKNRNFSRILTKVI